MLKEKIPNTHRETREKPSLSEPVDLALTVLSLLLALILKQHQTIRVHHLPGVVKHEASDTSRRS